MAIMHESGGLRPLVHLRERQLSTGLCSSVRPRVLSLVDGPFPTSGSAGYLYFACNLCSLPRSVRKHVVHLSGFDDHILNDFGQPCFFDAFHLLRLRISTENTMFHVPPFGLLCPCFACRNIICECCKVLLTEFLIQPLVFSQTAIDPKWAPFRVKM